MQLQKSYVKLKRITPVEVAQTYDVTVRDKHRLIANGFYTSNCWHNDIIEFITAKQTPGRLTKFNMSVNCTNEFMEKVLLVKKMKEEKASKDAIAAIEWNFIFPDTTYKQYKDEWKGDIKDWKEKGYPIIISRTVSVDWLWNLITESTYNRNEPGVLFMDRANELNELNYAEHIKAVNPCVTGDTMVDTDQGKLTIKEILNKFNNGGKIMAKTLNLLTGENEDEQIQNVMLTKKDANIIEIELDTGEILKLTPDHLVYTNNRGYVEAQHLENDDDIVTTNIYKGGHRCLK